VEGRKKCLASLTLNYVAYLFVFDERLVATCELLLKRGFILTKKIAETMNCMYNRREIGKGAASGKENHNLKI
jgi:hypothetical protein